MFALGAARNAVKKTKGRYSKFWDVEILRDWLRATPPAEGVVGARDRAVVCVALWMLARESDLQRLCIPVEDLVSLGDCPERIRIYLDHPKQWDVISGTGASYELELTLDRQDPALCPVRALVPYLRWRSTVHSEDPWLFVSTVPPFGQLSTGTIARILRSSMELAGVDGRYKPHSIRGAVASQLSARGVPLDEIARRGRWSTLATLKGHYIRPLDKKGTEAEE